MERSTRSHSIHVYLRWNVGDLCITRSIVEAHSGTIEVVSIEGVDTKVYVELPPYEPTLDRKRSAAASSPEV